MRPLARTALAAGLLLAGPVAVADAATSARLTANGTLELTGTAQRDVVTLRADPQQVLVDVGPEVLDLPLDDVRRVRVDARRGADRVRVEAPFPVSVRLDGGPARDRLAYDGLTGDDDLRVAASPAGARLRRGSDAVRLGSVELVDLRARRGADTLTVGDDAVSARRLAPSPPILTVLGGGGADTITGGRGADTLLGGGGDDTVEGAGGRDTALLGSGDDTFLWQPGDASDVVEGEGGRDGLRFAGAAGAEQVTVVPNGGRIRLTRDVGGIEMDLDDVERIDAPAGGGADTIDVADVGGTDLDELVADLAADGAPDRVAVEGAGGDDAITVGARGGVATATGFRSGLEVAVRGAQAPQDALRLDTGGGDDVVDADGRGAGALALTVDGAAGRDTLRFTGSGAGERFALVPTLGAQARLTRDVGAIAVEAAAERLVVAPRGGADHLRVADTGGVPVTELVADLGSDDRPDTIAVEGTDGAESLNLSGSAGAATLIGFGLRVETRGADADDDELRLRLLGGGDFLDATGLAADAIRLHAQGGADGDVLAGGGGPDTLLGAAGNDFLAGGPGADTLDGGSGTNTVIQD